jgi:UDP-N-acetylmuramate: L-alanyl-gamma-D-glutamyl-meso-diaminopimelate ligase
MEWSLDAVVDESPVPAELVGEIDELVERVAAEVQPGDQVVVMSNGGFAGVHQKLLAALEQVAAL